MRASCPLAPLGFGVFMFSRDAQLLRAVGLAIYVCKKMRNCYMSMCISLVQLRLAGLEHTSAVADSPPKRRRAADKTINSVNWHCTETVFSIKANRVLHILLAACSLASPPGLVTYCSNVHV